MMIMTQPLLCSLREKCEFLQFTNRHRYVEKFKRNSFRFFFLLPMMVVIITVE